MPYDKYPMPRRIQTRKRINPATSRPMVGPANMRGPNARQPSSAEVAGVPRSSIGGSARPQRRYTREAKNRN